MCPAFTPPSHITWKSLFRKSLSVVPYCSVPPRVTLLIYRGPIGTWPVNHLTHGALDHSYCIAGSPVCKTARVCCWTNGIALRWEVRFLGTFSFPSSFLPFLFPGHSTSLLCAANLEKEMLLAPDLPCQKSKLYD